MKTFKPYSKLSLTLTALSMFFTSSILAQDLCTPVLGGAIINVAAECLNDSSAFAVDNTVADEYGWQYTGDNPKDAVNGSSVGGNIYEIYGIAFRETQEEVCMVINSNLPLTGTENTTAEDDNVGWGDLFINLTSGDFLPTSESSELFGIRFSESNDSFAPEIGVYSNVKAGSVSLINAGFDSWQSYADRVLGAGQVPELGFDFGSKQTYYDNSISLNVIQKGNKLGDIRLLTLSDLVAMRYNSPFNGGNKYIGFCFDKKLIIDECGIIGGDGSTCTTCDNVACGEGLKKAGDEDKDGVKNCEDECPTDINKTTSGECGCGVSEDFCTNISCGNGIVQMGEDCDDGNNYNLDECSNTCVFTEDLFANTTCEDINISNTQRVLDNFAKTLDRYTRSASRVAAKQSLQRGKNISTWKKITIKSAVNFQVTAWTKIWEANPSSIHLTCNESGQVLCQLVDYSQELEAYKTNMASLTTLAKKATKRMKKEYKKNGSSEIGKRKFKQLRGKIDKIESSYLELLKEMPESTLACPDRITSTL